MVLPGTAETESAAVIPDGAVDVDESTTDADRIRRGARTIELAPSTEARAG
ncbi:MAG: hypothetical protein ACOC0F_02280 [archaeon]